MSRHWRLPMFFFIGSILLQVAWILTVPAFRGIDEFDHAYRAASVARGEWGASNVPAKHGRGYLVEVPPDIVMAATPECEIYTYVGHDNCRAAGRVPNGMVSVATAAASYNPVFYWLIGTASRPFRGLAALYAMRFCAALMCSVLLTVAAWQTTLWARTRWPFFSLILAMTPVTVYSTMLPAPNGIEMVAGLSLWAGLLGLTRTDLWPGSERLLLLTCIPGVACLATVRLLGPLWLGMIVFSVTCLTGIPRLVSLWRRQRGIVSLFAGFALVTTAAGLWWSVTAGTVDPVDRPGHLPPHPIRHFLLEVPLWVLQTIGAFPTRTEPAPTPVYAIGLLFFTVVLASGVWKVAMKQRIVFLMIAAASLVVPLAMVLLTYRHVGDVWQGRYQLPFALGIPLVASLIPEERKTRHRLAGPLLFLGWIALIVAHAMSVGHVLAIERRNSPLAGTAEWHTPAMWMVIALTIGGLTFWALAARQAPHHWRTRSVDRMDAGVGEPVVC